MREHLQALADSMTEILKVIREHGTPTINAHATIINKAHTDLFYAKKHLDQKSDEEKKIIIYETALKNLRNEFAYLLSIYELCHLAEKVPAEPMKRIWKMNKEEIDKIVDPDNLDRCWEKVSEWFEEEDK